MIGNHIIPMEHSIIYALDFDGVICDSAVETAIAGWKSAAVIWHDLPTPLPSQFLIDQFRQARAIIETGYEAILIMRMLHQGRNLAAVMKNYATEKEKILMESGYDNDMLKRLFGDVRDQWISDSLAEWIDMNPLFPGIRSKLKKLSSTHDWYILTTKQERFVSQILDANQIHLPSKNIFGMDRKISKETVLHQLLSKYPGHSIHFVEDRLATLTNVLSNQHLKNIQLFFADWGYSTANDKRTAAALPMKIINLQEFLND